MNTKLRLLLAVALFAAILISGNGAPAWADKLNIGAQAPSAAGPGIELAAGRRPLGTVDAGVAAAPLIPVTGGQDVVIGSCVTLSVKSPPAGETYTGSVVAESDLPKGAPGKIVGCACKITSAPGTTLGTDVGASWPLPPGTTGSVSYYDGTKWVLVPTVMVNGQASATLPPLAPGTVYFAVFGP